MAFELSVVIPSLDAANTLPGVLRALAEGGGEVEVVVVDGGSADATPQLAAASGATAVTAPRGRGGQLAAGARRASAPWLLFLHADTVPAPGWWRETRAFMADPANAGRAAAFRFALDDGSAAARRLEALVAWRSRRLGLPYGDQGLLLSRRLYESVGGYRPLPLMEDVDLIRRIGRNRVVMLETPAVTSATRYRRDGWLWRPLRNLGCLALYFAGVPPHLIARLYGR